MINGGVISGENTIKFIYISSKLDIMMLNVLKGESGQTQINLKNLNGEFKNQFSK